jgi:asparagine synthase (glutamine-hydrolysing)
MEEPVQAPSAYANHSMCRRIRRDGFGVVLSGSGGDEALAGYEWDFWPAARELMWFRGQRLEAVLHDAILQYGTPGRASSRLAAWARWGGRLPRRVARALLEGSGRRVPGGRRPAPPVLDGGQVDAYSLRDGFAVLGYGERRRYHLERAHLPYYLASNDRATLGIPVEHRQPFLDHRVVELGITLPPGYLFHRGWTKYVLRIAMRDLLPREVLWRREKAGFPFPLRRFLASNREELERVAARPVEHGLVRPAPESYADQLSRDPQRLWRICSTGFWLGAFD